ncbi:MAG TPA: multiheme c-type cytochrome [Planctomycetota bacterium]|nr:multiheme c-type cytochrome [Planctomycetota bacterium]
MSRISLRQFSGFVLLGLGAAVTFFVFRPVEAPAESRVFTSSDQCAACHATVFAEWQQSWHSRAWEDPDVQALSNDFANTDCIDCHAPRPVFETGVGQRVLPRSSRRAEGVDCISCHLLAEGARGTVAGTLEDSAAACRPVAMRELAQPEFCGVCHDQHKTVQQWRESSYPAAGVSCVDCHMPFRNGDPNQGRNHTMHGGHDIELVRSAVSFTARRDGSKLVAAVENVAAGHHFPTDERSRAADIFWRPLAAAGETPGPWRWAYRFRSPYRHEVDLVDTLLPAHEKREVVIEDEAARGAIELSLFYKITPYWKDPAHPDPDAEARLLYRVTLEP